MIGMLLNVVHGQVQKKLQKHIVGCRTSWPFHFINYASANRASSAYVVRPGLASQNTWEKTSLISMHYFSFIGLVEMMYRWILSIDAQVARFSFRVTGITYAVYTLFPRWHQTSWYHRGTNDGGWLLACEHHGSAYTVSSRQETCGEDDGKWDSKCFFCCWKKC